MSVRELVLRNRTCRRFKEDEPISMEFLRELVDLARLTPSAANLQPLKYVLSTDREMNKRIFHHLGWAAYLADWKGPAKGERPSAYIVVLGDKRIASNIDCDHGIAIQTMLLAAVEAGYAGCILGSVAREKLRVDLGLGDEYAILLVVALGVPGEERVVDPLASDGDPKGNVKYWRDDKDVHHVPKRALDELIVGEHA